jgi:hypothetical protein
MTSGPSLHLTWDELACRNRTRTPFKGIAPGGLVAPFQLDWRLSRAPLLAQAFELVRGLLGVPIVPSSSYRTPEFNAFVGGAVGSMHMQGLALDLPCPKGHDLAGWHQAIVALAQTPAGHLIRGIGYAPPDYLGGFVHIDCRQSVTLAQWTYPL